MMMRMIAHGLCGRQLVVVDHVRRAVDTRRQQLAILHILIIHIMFIIIIAAVVVVVIVVVLVDIVVEVDGGERLAAFASLLDLVGVLGAACAAAAAHAAARAAHNGQLTSSSGRGDDGDRVRHTRLVTFERRGR